MKKLFVFFLLINLYSICYPQNNLRAVTCKYKGVLIFFMSEPVNRYEVIDTVKIEKFKYHNLSDSFRIETIKEAIVEKANEFKIRNINKSFNAIIIKNPNTGILIKITKNFQRYLSNAIIYQDFYVYICSEPINNYEFIKNIEIPNLVKLKKNDSSINIDRNYIKNILDTIIFIANRGQFNKIYNYFDGIIINASNKVSLIKFEESLLSFKWKDKFILIVEHDESNQIFISKTLIKSTPKTLWANDGETAIVLCKLYNNINIVLMNYEQGYDRFREYIVNKNNKIKRKHRLPILAYSTNPNRTRIDCIKSGCVDLLIKPIQEKYLLKEIKYYIKRRKI